MLQFLLTICDEAYHSQIEWMYNNYYNDMLKIAVTKFKLLDRYNPVLDAEDAVQNCFLRMAKYADKLDFTNKAHLKNYALTILTHEMDRILKENSENIDFVEEFPEKNRYKFIEDICIKEQYNEVVRAIEQMDDIYGTTLFLVYCKDMTVNEIAEMMDVPAKTVYTRLARGKKMLIDSIKGDK